MKTMTADKAFAKIKDRAESIKNDDAHRIETMSVGDSWRQGDLYITRVESVPKGAKKMAAARLQLAPGDTQGSRHILDSDAGLTMFDAPNATALDGPIFQTTERRTVTHPEHGDVSLPPGCYAVTYQRAFADELRAQRD